MSGAVIGGNVRYPNLQSMADLFRAKINDTANNTTGYGTGSGNTAGLIMGNSNPDLQTFLYTAIEELYADLRNIGDPELILDNYILTGIPALTTSDPTVQVSLAYSGYFNGYTWSNSWLLPIGVSKMLAMWERQTGSGSDFYPMTPCPFGLPPVAQGQSMKYWEMRQGQIWMPGALTQRDLRLRARITFPTAPYSPTLNFQTTYVPILDCRNAVVAKMMISYSQRFAPELYQMSVAEEDRLMSKLRLEVVRQLQGTENQRSEFGAEATEDFAISFSWL